MECPYFKQVNPEMGYPIKGYCQADPEQPLRVPCIWELQDLCTSVRHACCPVYRAREHLEDLAMEQAGRQSQPRPGTS